MKSWQPPLILLALILPAAIGFAFGGPGFGIMLAGFCLVGLVVVALRAMPSDPIGRPQHPETVHRLLIVTTFPIEDARTIEAVAEQIELDGSGPETEIRLLTPAVNTFLDRWATDFRAARRRAQRDLVISVASLTLAGLDAGARVGDEDLVQAVEDQIATFDASTVILVSREGDGYDEAAETLRKRLRPPFHRVELSRG
ncbi:MAG TPA: hypothetical protein VMF31_12130 [Solirubrobacterales bacterium]|nr:hypothetical protein [Solirubrobacterales bacterium]